jgi:hypothetical protein
MDTETLLKRMALDNSNSNGASLTNRGLLLLFIRVVNTSHVAWFVGIMASDQLVVTRRGEQSVYFCNFDERKCRQTKIRYFCHDWEF